MKFFGRLFRGRAMMPKTGRNALTVLKEALSFLRKAEAEIIKLKERATDIEIDPARESAVEKLRNNFVDRMYALIDYWYDLPKKTFREKMQGLVFSILVVLDGEDGGLPPYAVKPLDENGNEGEDIAGYLHELFSTSRKEDQGL